MFNRRESLSQYIKLYPVVSTLIGINIIVYLMSLLPGVEEQLYLKGAAINYFIGVGEYWRLITAIFIHAGFLHLLFNMFSLYVFGPDLERFSGKMRFFTIYIVSGIMGNVVTYVTQDATYSSVGASGAIFGIFGAFAALVFYTRKIFPQLKQIIMPIIVISIVMTFVQSNINGTAHMIGLLTGFLIGLLFLHPKNMQKYYARQKNQL